jgi:hypothetical protein
MAKSVTDSKGSTASVNIPDTATPEELVKALMDSLKGPVGEKKDVGSKPEKTATSNELKGLEDIVNRIGVELKSLHSRKESKKDKEESFKDAIPELEAAILKSFKQALKEDKPAGLEAQVMKKMENLADEATKKGTIYVHDATMAKYIIDMMKDIRNIGKTLEKKFKVPGKSKFEVPGKSKFEDEIKKHKVVLGDTYEEKRSRLTREPRLKGEPISKVDEMRMTDTGKQMATPYPGAEAGTKPMTGFVKENKENETISKESEIIWKQIEERMKNIKNYLAINADKTAKILETAKGSKQYDEEDLKAISLTTRHWANISRQEQASVKRKANTAAILRESAYLFEREYEAAKATGDALAIQAAHVAFIKAKETAINAELAVSDELRDIGLQLAIKHSNLLWENIEKAASGMQKITSGIMNATVIPKIEHNPVPAMKKEQQYLVDTSKAVYAASGATTDVAKETGTWQRALYDVGSNVEDVYKTTGMMDVAWRKAVDKGFKRGVTEVHKLDTALRTGATLGTLIDANAENTADEMLNWNLQLGRSNGQTAVMAQNIRVIGMSTGVMGDNLLEAVKNARMFAEVMRDAGNLTEVANKNLISISASSKKFGTEKTIQPFITAMTSFEEFRKAAPGVQSFLTMSAQAGDKTGEAQEQLIAGNALNNPEAMKSITAGAKQFRDEMLAQASRGAKAQLESIAQTQKEIAQSSKNLEERKKAEEALKNAEDALKNMGEQYISLDDLKLKLNSENAIESKAAANALKLLNAQATNLTGKGFGAMDLLVKTMEDASMSIENKIKAARSKLDKGGTTKEMQDLAGEIKRLEQAQKQESIAKSMQSLQGVADVAELSPGKSMSDILKAQQMTPKELETNLKNMIDQFGGEDKDKLTKQIENALKNPAAYRELVSALQSKQQATDVGKGQMDMDKITKEIAKANMDNLALQEIARNMQNRLLNVVGDHLNIINRLNAIFGGIAAGAAGVIGARTTASTVWSSLKTLGKWAGFGKKVAPAGAVEEEAALASKAGGGILKTLGKWLGFGGKTAGGEAALASETALASEAALASKTVGGLSKTLGIFGKILGPLAIAIDGVMGAINAEESGRGMVEGGALGMLTGDVNKGSILSGLLGIEKNSLADEAMGIVTSIGRGALLGFTMGGPWGALAGAIVGLGAEIYKLWTDKTSQIGKVLRETWEELINEVKEIWAPIGKWIGKEIIDPLMEFLSPIGKWIGEEIIDPLMEFLSPIFDTMKEVFGWVYDRWVTMSAGMQKVFTWIWEEILSPIGEWIGEIIGEKWEDVKDTWNGLMNFFSNTYDNYIKPMIDKIEKAWNWLANAIGTLLKITYNLMIKPTLDQIGEWWTWFSDNIFKPLSDIMGSKWGTIKTKMGEFFTWVGNAWDDFWNNITLSLHDMKARWLNTWTYIGHAITDFKNSILDAFLYVTKSIAQAIRNIMGADWITPKWVKDMSEMELGSNSMGEEYKRTKERYGTGDIDKQTMEAFRRMYHSTDYDKEAMKKLMALPTQEQRDKAFEKMSQDAKNKVGNVQQGAEGTQQDWEYLKNRNAAAEEAAKIKLAYELLKSNTRLAPVFKPEEIEVLANMSGVINTLKEKAAIHVLGGNTGMSNEQLGNMKVLLDQYDTFVKQGTQMKPEERKTSLETLANNLKQFYDTVPNKDKSDKASDIVIKSSDGQKKSFYTYDTHLEPILEAIKDTLIEFVDNNREDTDVIIKGMDYISELLDMVGPMGTMAAPMLEGIGVPLVSKTGSAGDIQDYMHQRVAREFAGQSTSPTTEQANSTLNEISANTKQSLEYMKEQIRILKDMLSAMTRTTSNALPPGVTSSNVTPESPPNYFTWAYRTVAQPAFGGLDNTGRV